MSMSDFFRTLHASYQAELEDLSFDSDGRNVLRQRLQEKRGQLAFLCQMIELSPEMVAVVLHGGFHFEGPAAMERLIALEPEDFPSWDSLGGALRLTPWAQELAEVFLQQPQGEWFMLLAAGLEYLEQRASVLAHAAAQREHEHEPHAEGRAAHARDHDHGHDFDADDEHHHDHDHEESSAAWLEAHGFDRKE